MRRHSPPYYSPPRRGYGSRGRSPPRRGYGGGRGGKEQGSGSLLVRNIPLTCRPEDLRVPFERFGPVRDVYMPKDYYSGEPRGFAFIEFVDPHDASEAQYHMNRQVFGGREIAVVVAAESRKRPEDMCKRSKPRGPSGYDRHRPSHYGGRSRSRSRSRSPRYSSRARHHSRSYSPAPKSRHDNYYSPKRRQRSYTRSPRDHSREQHIQDEDRRINSPSYIDADRNGVANGHEEKPHDAEGSRSHRRSPRHPSVWPPGSRSRSADSSPRRNSK